MNQKRLWTRFFPLLTLGAFSAAQTSSTYCTAIYSSSSSDIAAFNPKDGSLMFTPVTGQSNANAVSLNPMDGYLYWVDQTAQAQYGGLFGLTLQYYYFNVYRKKADGSGSVQNVGYIN